VKVCVAGALAAKARNGGEAWVRLSYALGLRRLGCDVRLLEEAPSATPPDIKYAREVAARFGLDYAIGGETDEGGDLLVNVSGNIRSEAVRRQFTRTAFLDIDPGFTQLWHTKGIEEIREHDVYFTIGENIGTPGCSIPTCGIDWHPTRPPVVLEEWPIASVGIDRFTTVASWRGSYGRVEREGRLLGLKLDEFRKVLDLPRRAAAPFEIALDIHPDERRDLTALRDNGWRLVDPGSVAADPEVFRSYVRGSGAEFSVAKGIYVETHSGWFSDRTTRYLASGKPALVQDTGFALPAGEGLLTFRTLDEAVSGAEAIVADYDRHARAARALAEEHFESDRVLERLLADALA
jgi:hypothetical protein